MKRFRLEPMSTVINKVLFPIKVHLQFGIPFCTCIFTEMKMESILNIKKFTEYGRNKFRFRTTCVVLYLNFLIIQQVFVAAKMASW